MYLTTTSAQIVTGTWWFFILIVVSSYTAQLASWLTVNNLEKPITDFDTLSRQSEIKYGTVLSTSFYDFLKNKAETSTDADSMWRRLFHMVKDHSVSSPHEGFEKVLSGKGDFAFLWDVAVIDYKMGMDETCRYATIADSVFQKGYGIAVQQGNPIKDLLNMEILNLQDDGSLSNLKKRWWDLDSTNRTCEDIKKTAYSGFTLESFIGVFLILFSGLFIARLILFP